MKGSCLCGGVRYEFDGPLTAFRYCHCSRCRKATGAAHAANIFVPQSQFRWIAGVALVRRYDLPGAKRFAVATCATCGTRVPHKVRERDDYLVPAGAVDGELGAHPEGSIFWSSRASWYVEPHEMDKHDEYSPPR
jgi:hypothetical protein